MRSLLRGGSVVDVRAGVARAADVLVDGGRIAGVGAGLAAAGATVVECGGRFLMPGLIDLHTHPGLMDGGRNDPDGLSPERARADLATWLRHGVTTVLSLGLDRDFAFDLAHDGASRARLLTAGHGFGVSGGLPPFQMDPPGPLRMQAPHVVRRILEEQRARGAIAMKLWFDDWYGMFPKMAADVAREAIRSAREAGLRTFAHVYAVDDAKRLVGFGLETFAHMPRDRVADDALWALCRERDVAVVSTLTVPATNLEHLGDVPLERRREDLRCARANVTAAYRAGVRFGFGTDAGVSRRAVGTSEHAELEMLVDCGVTPADALRMATLGSAELLGRDDLGEIAPGRHADIVALRADPLADIRNVRQVETVWLEGASS